MKILIAEDDYASRLMLETVLKRMGHETVVTENGAEAWDELQKDNAPLLAILDWMMPRMDGLDVIRKERAAKRESYKYLILLTAKFRQEDINAGFEAGADDYLIKPLEIEQLSHRLRAAERILSYEAERRKNQEQLSRYADNMEKLAEERARQLVHADKMVTLGTLSAGIAHEIMNPTTFISGNIQTMEKAVEILQQDLKEGGFDIDKSQGVAFVNEEFPKMFSGMRRGVERITRIVGGLKSFARQDSGEKRDFKLIPMVDMALELCNNVLKYNVTVHRDLSEDLPGVHGDRQKVEQVLVNLITNAAHAMEGQKNAEIYIIAEAFDKGIRFMIRDNGPGIPDEIRDKIFNPFFTTKKDGQGTGLGLSISKGIIEEHGGELKIENRPEGGAEFSFILPAAGVSQTGGSKGKDG